MFNRSQLTQEIEAVIGEFERANASVLHPDWITQAVVDKHADVDGEDADFWRVCGRAEVRNQVRQRLNRFRVKAELEPDAQLVLAGFERLQQRYVVEDEHGEQVAIRVQYMTRTQRLRKADELDAMGDGCHQHAGELRRYDAQAVAAA